MISLSSLSLQVQKLNSWGVRSVHCTLSTHRLEKNLPLDVACAETHTHSKPIHVIRWKNTALDEEEIMRTIMFPKVLLLICLLMCLELCTFVVVENKSTG